MKKKIKAFTLIELMVVIIMVSILAAASAAIYTGKVDAAKWSEGKAIMGTIANAIRAYAAENSAAGEYGQDMPSMQNLGFIASDLQGTYFSAENFSWQTSFNSGSSPSLAFTITASAPGTIKTPQSITLDQAGQWTNN